MSSGQAHGIKYGEVVCLLPEVTRENRELKPYPRNANVNREWKIRQNRFFRMKKAQHGLYKKAEPVDRR